MPKFPYSPFLLDPASDPVPPANGQSARAALDLDAAALFVVATLRSWVAPLIRPGEDHPDCRDLFAMAGVGAPGVAAFDALMVIIGSQAIRLIDMRCCTCCGVGEDEEAMLRLVAALQAADRATGIAVLIDWLPEEAVPLALHAAWCFAAAMAEAGLVLRPSGRIIPFPAGRTMH
ncbi:hypothetical protein [Falsiroseomonas sp.]|uniref:hypothetical protein n=1 Tax=Falsiroseomonas sp. TaxID=2870721 RepID=UPI003F71C7C0